MLESEWSPNLYTVIPYVITVKTGLVPNHTTPPQFETIATYSYNPTTKIIQKKTKENKRKLKKKFLLVPMSMSTL